MSQQNRRDAIVVTLATAAFAFAAALAHAGHKSPAVRAASPATTIASSGAVDPSVPAAAIVLAGHSAADGFDAPTF